MVKCEICGQDKGKEPMTLDLPFVGTVILLEWERNRTDCQFCQMEEQEAFDREGFQQAVASIIDAEIDKGNLIPRP